MKKISIIIPCYNVEFFIKDCITSILSQNLAEKEFEIIIVNDGSTDESYKIAKNLERNNANITVYSHENKGLGGARNTGIENAAGEYILFLDADDRLLPRVLPKLLDLAKNDDLDMLEFSAQGINEKAEVIYHYSNKSNVYSSGFCYYQNVRYMNSACNKLYKRNFLIVNKLFFLQKIYIEDFEFNTRCLAKAQRLKATDIVGSQFYQSSNSITRTSEKIKREKMISDLMIVLEKTKESYQFEFKTKETERYFSERLSYITTTLFYQLFKNKATYHEVQSLKKKLQEKELFYIDHPVYEFKKNLLRLIVVKNLGIYKCWRWFL